MSAASPPAGSTHRRLVSDAAPQPAHSDSGALLVQLWRRLVWSNQACDSSDAQAARAAQLSCAWCGCACGIAVLSRGSRTRPREHDEPAARAWHRVVARVQHHLARHINEATYDGLHVAPAATTAGQQHARSGAVAHAVPAPHTSIHQHRTPPNRLVCCVLQLFRQRRADPIAGERRRVGDVLPACNDACRAGYVWRWCARGLDWLQHTQPRAHFKAHCADPHLAALPSVPPVCAATGQVRALGCRHACMHALRAAAAALTMRLTSASSGMASTWICSWPCSLLLDCAASMSDEVAAAAAAGWEDSCCHICAKRFPGCATEPGCVCAGQAQASACASSLSCT